jgi:hypothetical protein
MSEPGFASLGPSLLARKGGAKPAMRPQVAPLVADEAELAALADEQLEDLGWNDMGHDSAPESGAEVVPISADVSAHLEAGFAAEGGPIVRRQQRRLEERLLADAAMTGPEDREPEYDEEDEALYADAFDGLDEDEDENGDAAGFASLAPQLNPLPAIAAPVPTRRPAKAPAALPDSRPAARKARVPATEAGRRAAFTLRLDADRHLKLRLAATMQGVSAQALVTEALDRLLAEYGELDLIASHLKRH